MSHYATIIILTGILGASLTYWVQHFFSINAVKASAGLSLLVAFAAYIFPDLAPQKYILMCPAVFFGASFIGMTSRAVLPRLWHIAIAGALFSLIFLNTSTYFEGFGGALGTTACIAVVLIFGIKIIVGGSRATKIKKT